MRIILATLALLFAWLPAARAAEPVDYERQVKPIFAARCFACHGALKQEGSLRLDTGALVRQGGDSGAAVVPSKVDESLLVARISATDLSERMPPEGEALTPAQIETIKSWIAAGAVSPADEQPEKDPAKHWAFVPPFRAALPAVKNQAWVASPIDAFIAARQEAAGLAPVAPADKPTLLRRVYLDLVGLPPSRAELQAFLADDSPDAYERVVDRLLASPQYGERWGRHWMDIWRYSDWYGRRMENDVRNSYPHIWRWRDWILRSLNDDKGYDRMVAEMLAADELAPEDDETVVATGFIVRNFYSLNYDFWMRDLVEHTGKAFLGLRLNCAHCHDHKYDPIAQQEYFRFRAFFEPIELRQDRVPGGGDLPKFVKYVPGSNSSSKPIEAGLARIFDDNLKAETFMYSGGDARQRIAGRPPVTPGGPAILGGANLAIEPVTLPAVASYPGRKQFIREEEIAQRARAIADATAALEAAKQNGATAIAAAALRLAAAQLQQQTLVTRLAADDAREVNSPEAPNLAKQASRLERAANLTAAKATFAEAEFALAAAQQKVTADAKAKPEADKAAASVNQAKANMAAAEKAAAVESDQYTPLSPTYPNSSTGRRTALARWLTAREHPLTARVAVNHIWARHFGRPLVESVFDFGRSGKEPTHPELLDWLAVELMESGWKMKPLHRLIVTSSAYRMQSSRAGASAANLAADRDNRWLWHFPVRRMEAEVIRDSLLHTAGQLDRTMFGPQLPVAKESVVHRRSLYFEIFAEGGGQMQFAGLFDSPDPGECYRRTESIMPQQALATTNSELAVSQGRLLARQLWSEISTQFADEAQRDEAMVTAAFEQVLSRPPRADERQACREFLVAQRALYASAPPAAAPAAANLPTPAATDPHLRAAESLVRSLYSHNDFVTIR